MNLYFTNEIHDCLRSVQYASGSENVLRLNMQWYRSIPNGNTKICRRRSGSVDDTELGHFTLLFALDNKKNVQRFLTHVHSCCSAH